MIEYFLVSVVAMAAFALGSFIGYHEGKRTGHTEGYFDGYEQCEQDIGIFEETDTREFEDLAGEDKDNV